MPALVQTVKQNGGGYVNSYTFSITPTAGNFLTILFACGASDTYTISDNKGNTYVVDKTTNISGARQSSILHAANVAGGATTITVQMGSGQYADTAIIVQEWSGMPTTIVVDSFGISNVTSGTSYVDSDTVVAAPVLMIGAIANDSNAPAFTGDSGWTNLLTQAGSDLYTSMVTQYRTQTSAVSTSWTLSNSSSRQASMVIVAYRYAGSGGTTPHTITKGLQYALRAPGASGYNPWYPYGSPPNLSYNTRMQYLASAWATWKAFCFVHTGMPSGMPTGAWRVTRPDQVDPNGHYNGTVSEGIGYGMLGAVYMGDPANPQYDSGAKAIFDGLWQYYKFFKNSNGLMNYSIDYTGTVVGTGGATDADQDVAFALIRAHRTWGSAGAINYSSEATTLLTAIMTYEFYSTTNATVSIRNTMINGDSWDSSQSGSPDWIMPDYFAPAYYTEFASFTSNTRWTDIKAANYPLMVDNWNVHNTGLVPDQGTREGGAVSGQSYENGYNAVRRFRQVIDYLWNGGTTYPQSYFFAKQLADYMKAQSGGVPASTYAEYALDGSSHGTYINDAFLQSYMMAALVTSTDYQFSADIATYINGHTDASYFGDSLAFVGLLVASGFMTPTPKTVTNHTPTKSMAYVVRRATTVTKSLTYEIKHPTTVTKSVKYTVKTSHTLTKGLVYEVRAGKPLSKSNKYVVKTSTTVTKSVKYNTKRTTTLTKSLKYNTKRTTTLTKGLIYEIRAGHPVSKTVVYLVRTAHSLTKSVAYKIRNNHSITKGLQYEIDKSRPVTKSAQYVVKSNHTLTKSAKYNTVRSTALTKSLQYITTGIGRSITKSTAYMVKHATTLSKSLQYEIDKTRPVTKPIAYMVRRPTTLSKTLKYVVKAPRTLTKAAQYTVKHPVTKTLSARYATKRSPTLTKSVQYEVTNAGKSITKGIKYTVRAVRTLTKALQYEIRHGSSITKGAVYKIRTNHTISKTLQYEVKSLRPITKSNKYTVKTSSLLQKSVKYTARTSQVRTRPLQYEIKHPSSPIAKAAKYLIRTHTTMTKALRYVVDHGVSPITKPASYKVITNTRLAKALRYDVAGSNAITKSLQYVVILPVHLGTVTTLRGASIETVISLGSDEEEVSLRESSITVILKQKD